MIGLVKPEFRIKIGIKNDKVVEVDWSGMKNIENADGRKVTKRVRKYLKKAIKYIK